MRYRGSLLVLPFVLLLVSPLAADVADHPDVKGAERLDRKSTRLNSSHRCISYAVFCLKKNKNSTYNRPSTWSWMDSRRCEDYSVSSPLSTSVRNSFRSIFSFGWARAGR